MYVIGVDGTRNGWIAVGLVGGRFAGAAHFDHFHELFEAGADAAAIGVDMPIGLVKEGLRHCDRLVKEFVGERRASVFMTPPRPALASSTFDQANSLTRQLTGSGLTKQSFSLRTKVLEVDAVVRNELRNSRRAKRSNDKFSTIPPDARPYGVGRQGKAYIIKTRESRRSLRRYARVIERGGSQAPPVRVNPFKPAKLQFVGGRIIEVHPEASFRQMHGQPLAHNKKTYNGSMLRMRLLEEQGINIPGELGEIGSVAVDDLLDAAAVAWTTHRYVKAEAVSLPPEGEWQHDGDRPIAIWI